MTALGVVAGATVGLELVCVGPTVGLGGVSLFCMGSDTELLFAGLRESPIIGDEVVGVVFVVFVLGTIPGLCIGV